MKITIEIPDGPRCCFSPTRLCKLCIYAGHLQYYNCRLYGRLLKGGKIPVKCPECIAANGLNDKE